MLNIVWLELGLEDRFSLKVRYLLKLYLNHIGLEILMEIALGSGMLLNVLMFPVFRPDQNYHKSNHFQELFSPLLPVLSKYRKSKSA